MSAADALGLPPGVRFDPTPEELVEFYLMPRALGQPTAVPGIIIEDAEATTSSHHPWKLLTRHRRTDDDEAYFFERIASGDAAAKGGAAARQDRSCGGERWTWEGQKRLPDEVLPLRGEGEQVSWGKYSLNLHKGRRKGGSTGWVMHEYTIASPQCPCPVKLCHVAFTGHGQKRQRVPDDDGEELEAGTPPHKRVAAASTPASSVITMATPDQEQPFPDYLTSSSVANFWGSEAGFSQESSIRFSQESSIPVLDPWYPDAGTSHQEPFVLDQGLAQNQEYFSTQPQAYHQEQFVNQEAPSAEAFCAMQLASGLGSDAGFSQDSSIRFSQESSIPVLDPWYPDAGTSHQEPFVLDQGLAQNQEYFSTQPQAYHQEQFVNQEAPSAEASCAMQLASGQEPPSGQPQEEQFRRQLDQLLGCPPAQPVSDDSAYHEERIQTLGPAATADLPLPVDQESSHGDMDGLTEFFKGWGDFDTFTDTSGVQDYDYGTAAGILAGDGPGYGTCYDGGNGNFAVMV